MVRKRLSDKATTPRQRLIILALVIALIYIVARSDLTKVGEMLFLGKPAHVSSVIESTKGFELKRPVGVAVNEDRIYVTDAISRSVKVYDKDGVFLKNIGEAELSIPVYLAVDNEGYIYVTDRKEKVVFKFNKGGNFIGKFGSKHLKSPLGIAADMEGNVYITDVGAEHRVVILSTDGELKKVFGKKKRVVNIKKDGGYFFFPNDIAIQRKSLKSKETERIYVSDSNNKRIQAFDKDGNFKAIIATGGLPRGIAFNNKVKRLFAVDALGHKINVYDDSGHYKFRFGKQGRDKSSLMYPNDIALLGDNEDDIVITDRQNKRVQLFSAKVDLQRLWKYLYPLVSLLPLPLFLLLFLLVASRKKKYIVSDCFIDEVLTKGRLDDFIFEKKKYHITPYVEDFLAKENIAERFLNKLKHNRKVSRSTLVKIMDMYKVDENHAEILALAYRRFIYHPVLLCCNDKLLKAAHELGIDAQTPGKFFGEEKKGH